MKIYADLHCDMLSRAFDDNKEPYDRSLMFNFSDVQCMLPYIQLCAVFINSKYEISKYGYGNVRANKILNWYNEKYSKLKEIYNLYQINTKRDVKFVTDNKKIGIVLTIENMSAIGNDIKNLEILINNGIKIASLTWNGKNLIASGSFSKVDTGVSKFGFEVIKKMDKHGMILDVSHLSDNSFFDVINYGYKKIMATHSCARSICNSERNLSDEQMKYIAISDGVIGICLYNRFLNDKSKNASIDDIIDHVIYISNLVGIDKVCIGSDFDGLEKEDLPTGIYGVKDLNKIEERMLKRKFSQNEIEKVFGKNLKNFLIKSL